MLPTWATTTAQRSMKVAVVGGTGFVGHYLLDALIAQGDTPRVLVRPGAEAKLDAGQRSHCETLPGSIADPAALAQCASGADAVVYLVGLLREDPAKGVTFESHQRDGVRDLLAAARGAGVTRCLLMSANGVRPDGTDYQRTKYEAEQLVQGSGLRWTVFRPSVIFGDPRGRMEFCTQLQRDLIGLPLPAPLFFAGFNPLGAGRFRLSPVHVRDVAQVMARSLHLESAQGRTYPLGGPEALTWNEIIQTISRAARGRGKLALPVPAFGVAALAALLDRQPWFPLTRDQLTMLLEGNSCESGAVFEEFGIVPQRFDEASLGYLRGSGA